MRRGLDTYMTALAGLMSKEYHFPSKSTVWHERAVFPAATLEAICHNRQQTPC